MKEYPILFNGEMVRAILEGRKTQTRRAIKIDSPTLEFDSCNPPWPTCEGNNGYFRVPCPYGQPGCRLWVRETFKVGAWRNDGRICFDYKASPEIINTPWCKPSYDQFNNLAIQSNIDCREAECCMDEYKYIWEPGESPCRWRPSIHMPRLASRITLEIINVRVERLNDISDQDCHTEGTYDKGLVAKPFFKEIWEEINGKNSWALNPWVWVIEFKKI